MASVECVSGPPSTIVPPVQPRPQALGVFGVSACGKSTVARLLAARVGAAYLDGDDYHPPRNIEKMRRGEALTDADRVPWLLSLHDALARCLAATPAAVLACSALTP